MLNLVGTKLYHENGVELGDVLAKEDGYYDFWPILNGGCWPSYLLRAIADLLDEKNKVWDLAVRGQMEEARNVDHGS